MTSALVPAKLVKAIRVTLSFSALHLACQIVAFCSGIAVVRILTIHDYATYALLVAMVSAGTIMANSGFSSFLLSRGGPAIHQPRAIGELVQAVRRGRSFGFIVVALPASSVTWALSGRIGASNLESASAVAIVLLSVFLALRMAIYRDLLLLSLRYTRFQIITLADSGLRTLMVLALASIGMASPTTILYLTTPLTTLVTWIGARTSCHHLISPVVDPAQRGDVVIEPLVTQARSSFLRLLPSNTYAALQGQIAILILASLGASSSIAQVGATARFVQVFAVVSSAAATVLAPRFARVPSQQIKRSILYYIAGSATPTALLLAPFLIAPGIFLRLLGGEYSDAQSTLKLLMCAGAIAALGDVLSSLNQSRGWIDITWLQVPSSVTLVILAALTVDLRHIDGVLLLTILGASARLVVNAFQTLRGALAIRPPVINSPAQKQYYSGNHQ